MHWQTFGHEKNKKYLEILLNSESLFGSFLFLGPASIGKKTLAVELAGKLLNSVKLEGHPDFLYIDSAKSGVENIRNFIESLNQKPFIGQCKVAIIDNAESLNVESLNALLKSIEEPKPQTAIFIISAAKLLPTIHSRCQVSYFNKFTPRQLSEYSKSFEFAVSPEHLALSFGSIGRLKNFLSDKKLFSDAENNLEKFKSLLKANNAERLAMISDFSEADVENLKSLILSWIFYSAENLSTAPQKFTTTKSLLSAYVSFNSNKNKKLVLQNLFLNL
jgi:DNA polymerase-3 subunit delta'